MDGFNGKEFYGYGYSSDPKLQTTTRNYEFKFNNPDTLEAMISRVRKDRGRQSSESEEFEFLSDRLRNQYFKKPRPVQSELPKNVDTEVGRAKLLETVVKVMSDEDMEEMMSEHRLIRRDVSWVNKINLEDSRTVQKLSKSSIEIFPPLQPQWVEIKPVQKSIANVSETRIPTNSSCKDDSSDYQEVSELDLRDETVRSGNENENENDTENDTENETENENEENHEQPKKNQINDKAKLLSSLSFDSNLSEDFLIRRTELNKNDDNIDHQKESPPTSPVSLGSESNLNSCETREVRRVFGNSLLIPKMEFHDIQYESENSESDQERQSNVINIPNFNFVNKKKGDVNSECADERTLDSYAMDKSENSLSFQSARSDETISPKPKKNPKKSLKSPKPTEKGSVVSSIESLKKEKLRIFSKMTTIQEKMIKLLDQLRMSLVEISLPDGEIEKKTRERNALEFSVRFSRNYLFPLQKMIDDLRITPKEEYRSALTNEPCVKVCGIYGLLLQAVQCYQKQLRHFFSDSFPKKLDQLLNQIMEATNICLEKQIFDKRDMLIQSLLYRSDMFLGFVMEFAKKKTARTEEISTGRKNRFKLPKKTSSKFELTMSLNNLNMYEPKLVPKKPKKTVTKKQPEIVTQKTSPKVKKTKDTKESLDNFAFLLEDTIDTQVGKDTSVDCLQLIDDAISDQPDSALAKAVIDTLQDITKDEVHQMFGPIVTSLDSILKSSNDPQKSVEMFLNVLKSKLNLSKAPKHQQKIDGIVTEISRQKNRTHQVVAKKGTHSTRIKEQKQQKQELLKENEDRQSKVSKPRAKTPRKTECSYMSVKGDRTERTERYSSRSQPMDSNNTKCDKQSQATPLPMTKIEENNGGEDDSDDAGMYDVAAAGSSEAFLSARAAAAAAKKPKAAVSYTKLEAAPKPESITSIALLEAELTKLLKKQSVELSSKAVQADNIISIGHCGDDEPEQKIIDTLKQKSVASPCSSHTVKNSITDSRQRNRSPSLLSPVKNEHSNSSEIEKLMYRKNALYTFIKYLEKNSPVESENEAIELSPTESNSIENFYSAKTVAMETKQEEDELEPFENKEFELEPRATQSTLNLEKCNAANKKKEDKKWHELDILEMIEDRNAFIEKCRDDPLYNNPQFPEPWKVLSKISTVIAHEVVENFEYDISFGEESYIRDFINMEVQD